MAIKTYAQQLEEVQAAISAVLTDAQAVEFNGRSVTRADLRELRKWESELRAKVARSRRGGIRTLRVRPK